MNLVQQDNNKWSLFGLDLSLLARRIALGWQQLLYDGDSWFFQRFDPAIAVIYSGECTVYQAYRPISRTSGDGEDCDYTAVALPPDAVLFKTLHLPAGAESELDSAVELDVGLSSPFPPEDTVAAWRVVSREQGDMSVLLAMTHQMAIDEAIGEFARSESNPDTSATSLEVWALSDTGKPVILSSTRGSARRRDYHRSVIRLFAGLGLMWVVLIGGALAIAMSSVLRAEQLNDKAKVVQIEAQDIASQRAELMVNKARLRELEDALMSHPNYQFWLNQISASAPDNVYFDRLKLEGWQVTANGYSNNASVYLRLLTEQPRFTNVEALSAFARDRNTGLERFSIAWSIAQPSSPSGPGLKSVAEGAAER